METKLTSVRQTARLVGVTPAWLKSEIDAGRIPHLRAGRRVLLDPDAVTAALLARARQAPSGGEGQR